MKRFFGIGVLALVVALTLGTLTLAAEEESAVFDLPDGVYVGVAPGYGGEIKIQVELAEGRIVDLVVVEHKETPFLSDAAFDRLLPSILEKQTVELDIITGATVTSKGILNAVADALVVEEPVDDAPVSDCD